MRLRKILRYVIQITILFAWLVIVTAVSRIDPTWLLFISMFVCAATATIVSDNLVWLIPIDDVQTQQEEFKESSDWFWGLALPLCVVAVGFSYLKNKGMIPLDAFYFYFFGGFVGGVVVARFVEILARDRILQRIQERGSVSRSDRP